ncbi:MAG TPA: hypothetical protein VI455_15475 [Terriglobia bacterium]
MRVRLGTTLAVAMLGWALTTGAGWSQQTDQQANSQTQTGQQGGTAPQTGPTKATPGAPPAQPLPPLSPSGTQGQAGGTGPAEETPPADTRPLAGAQEITPSLPGEGRSYILPSFSVYEAGDTNAQLQSGSGAGFEVATIPEGSIELNKVGSANQIGLTYAGGGLIYNTDLSQSATFQYLGLSDTYSTRRWKLLLADRVSYLPQASEGFGGIGLAGSFNTAQSLGLGTGFGALNPMVVPGQSILTTTAGATTNVGVAQAQYSVSPRSSISAFGSYGIFDYSQPGLAGGNERMFSVSYDHNLTSVDTVSVSYSFIANRFSAGTVKINENLWRLGYGRRITDRLSLTLLAGPEFISSAVQAIPGVNQQWSYVVQGSFRYQLPRTGLSLSYLHYTTPGSGVYYGAQTDTLNGGVNRELSRKWTVSLYGNYSRNAQLGSFSVNPNVGNPGVVNYETGTFRLSRIFGRYTRGFLVYTLEHQQSATAVSGAAGRVIIRQIFGIGVELHPRPLAL